jgi:hypothetical protein
MLTIILGGPRPMSFDSCLMGTVLSVPDTCIILHNMIIEDEKDIKNDSFDLNEEATTSIVQVSIISHGHNLVMEEVLQRNAIFVIVKLTDDFILIFLKGKIVGEIPTTLHFHFIKLKGVTRGLTSKLTECI